MSDELSVETQAVRAFAASNAGIAGDIAGVANIDVVKNVTALTPVFGLIGADYLALFAAAQVLQAKDMNDLSAKYAKLSDAAFKSANAYDITDMINSGAMASKTAEIAGGL
ncbi:type VII secretion target [Nocardia arthritidis]|uniref:ESX-1 secretion-associated protein n=1 Tax=Nocardia arthritidis TaxID=228602 RepID=A0A6G9YKC0_9NOCA|nr:type VII secretion target [Nocardia arthritidis]QIS13476.1 ESX-1 secretion-associated protein [Nocardia arthritidis]